MNWRINRIMHPVYNLGPGRRIGIWVQGCTLGCEGCLNKRLWSADGGRDVPIQRLVRWISMQENVDGVTVTGGEPFQQYEAFIAFCAYLKELTSLHTYVFSGYYLSELRERFPDRLFARYVDQIVAGRYVRERHDNRNVRGSSNQTLYTFDEGRAVAQTEWQASEKWSVAVDDAGQVFMAGIPKEGELQAISDELEDAGIDLRFV